MNNEDVQSHLSDLANVVRASNAAKTEPKRGRVGKYIVGDPIGRGGQSVAMRAWDPDLERDVVLKVYHSAETPEQREQVLKEGRALAKIASPYVARCHTVETFANNPCLVLEYVPGMNLASQVQLSVYSPEDAAEVIAKIADGLEAVHQCGLVHRDLKPDNIVIQSDGTPKIIDFGLSTRGAASVQDTSGTAVYMPPERALGDSGGDVRGDIFGLGTILYEMLTGRPPFIAASREEALENARRGQLSAPLPNPHHGVSKVCLQCLCPAPAKRYKSAAEAAEAVRRSVRGFNKNYLLVALVLLLPFVGFAISKLSTPATQIHWVDARAKADGNGSTVSAPFMSVDEAVRAANPGDTIRIRGYDETHKPLRYRTGAILLEETRHDGITIETWGAANPVQRPDNEAEWRPVLDGAYPVSPNADEERNDFRHGSAMFEVRASNVTFRDIAISGASDAAFLIGGSEEAVTDIVIDNCEVYRSRGPAVACQNARRVHIEDCVFRICAEQAGLAAIEISESNTLSVVENEILNPAKEITAAGISVYQSSDLEIDANFVVQLSEKPAVIVRESNRVGVNRTFIHDCGTGIRIIGPTRSVEVDLFGNLIAQCRTAGIVVDDDAPITQLYVYYNTILDCGDFGVRLDATSIRDSQLRNNLLMNDRGAELHVRHRIDLTIENNAWPLGRLELPDGFDQLGTNIEVPLRDGRPEPQLQIQQQQGLAPHKRTSYTPLPSSVLIEKGKSYRLRTDITACAAGRDRDPKRCDIGAVEHAKE